MQKVVSTLAPQIMPPNTGTSLQAFGDELQILLAGEQTGGQFALLLTNTAPGNEPPPHYHEREDECFYPLSGRVV